MEIILGNYFFFVEEKSEQILKMGINCPWWVWILKIITSILVFSRHLPVCDIIALLYPQKTNFGLFFFLLTKIRIFVLFCWFSPLPSITFFLSKPPPLSPMTIFLIFNVVLLLTPSISHNIIPNVQTKNPKTKSNPKKSLKKTPQKFQTPHPPHPIPSPCIKKISFYHFYT